MGNDLTKTWEEIIKMDSRWKRDFEEKKYLLDIERVEIRRSKRKIEDLYVNGIFERNTMWIIIKFKSGKNRIAFESFFQPGLNDWVTTDIKTMHMDGVCHVCQYYNAFIDNPRYCGCINVIDLKYILEKIKKMRECRLHFIL
ncbi:TPA: hypothetical protein ACGW5B_005524 [Bacillus paranthracis]|uniref:hypothetical protein n=1 Tax=Bacillus cereus group TaxID=86661 RepID=UPI001583BCB9|nr:MULTISPECIES: hypothetical protein [Bacillus cereus group]MDX5839908.1 hypothetical protein [Bacillus cereus group sp. BfR-BA-01700]MDX5846226.1 hypothetical protein [Bacillus cereus group sp. BfR-BA-01233]MDX5941860.1 hypothetical protein [Bacillus cereus group sp. BfR-BA-00415]NUJ08498.1 hypothetical protein [Bacillus paranthracis]